MGPGAWIRETELMTQPMYPVDDMQRDRAVAHLQAQYAQGVIDEAELDRRLDLALEARDRAQLNSSLQGLARIAPQVLTRPTPSTPSPAENVGAGLVHLSAFVTWCIGPAIAKAVAAPGSRMWWEAGRALSLQLVLGALGAASVLAAITLGTGRLVAIAWMIWVIGTIVAAVRAFNGQTSTGRLGERLPLAPQDPRGLR